MSQSMLYRRAPVEGQLESLRFLNCADIFSASLVNSAYSSIVESNRSSLPNRAISIRYWQGYPKKCTAAASGDDTDLETLEECKAYDAVVATEEGYCEVGLLKVEDRSGSNKRIFRAFPVAVYEEGEEHPIFHPLPEEVEQMLRRVLFDRVLGVVERLDVNNYSTTDFSSKMFSLLCTAIEVPVRELHVHIEHAIDAWAVERLAEQLGEKVGIHSFRFSSDHGDYVKACAGFDGEAIFVMKQWINRADTLVERILTSRYNPRCRLLLRLGEHDDCPKVSASFADFLSRQLYALFGGTRRPVYLPPHGVWLHFPAIEKDSLPDSFWIGVLGGVEPTATGEKEVTLPLPKGVYGENGWEKECKCTVYNIAANREHTLRVCVGGTSNGGRLLVQLTLQERPTGSEQQSI